MATTNNEPNAAADDELEAFLASQKQEEEKQRMPSVPVRQPAQSIKKVEPKPEPILAPLPSKPAAAAKKAPVRRNNNDSSDENESSDGSDSSDAKPVKRAPPPKIGGAKPLPTIGGSKPLPTVGGARPSTTSKKPAFNDDSDEEDDWKPPAKVSAPASKAPAKRMAFFDDDSD